MPHIAWTTEMSTGVNTLDELHRNLFEAMSESASASDKRFAECYSALTRKMKCALIQEEKWLEMVDPTLLKMYQEQHAAILSALDNVHLKVLDGDYELGRKVCEDLLPQWYAIHVSTLDMALAIVIQMNNIQVASPAPQSSEIYID